MGSAHKQEAAKKLASGPRFNAREGKEYTLTKKVRDPWEKGKVKR